MKKAPNLLNLLLIAGITIIAGCQTKDIELTANELNSGYFETIKGEMFFPNGFPYASEISAIAVVGNQVLLLNDKTHPNASPVLVANLQNFVPDTAITGLTDTLYKQIRKYEGTGITPDEKFVFLMPAFNDTAAVFNQIIYAPCNALNSPKKTIFRADKKASSMREAILKVLSTSADTVKYIKIEGFTVIPGNKILLGIRELGASFSDFEYKAIIISFSYTIENNEIIIENDAQVLMNNNISGYAGNPGLALSSLEYSKYTDQLFLLFSIEAGSQTHNLGGHLFSMQIKNLGKNNTLSPVLNNEKLPYRFIHKTEGIAAIDATHFIVVADDDRVTGLDSTYIEPITFRRKLQQSAYSVIEIK